MTPADRARVLAAAGKAADQRSADVEAAVAEGSRGYRRRVVRAYAIGAFVVIVVAAAALGIGVASGATLRGGSPVTAATSTPEPTTLSTTSERPIPTKTHTSRPSKPPPTTAPPTTAPPTTVAPTTATATASAAVAPKLEMTERTLSLVEGQSMNAQVVDWSSGNATPVPASDLVWTSADETVATVSDLGVVTGVHEGTTTVTASKDTSVATLIVHVSIAIK